MAETEVESILREIRERVLSQQRANKDITATRSPATNAGNGGGESDPLQQNAPQEGLETPTAEALSLINSYLATTARAWDRLPPLVSNRSGLVARVELWLKRRLKAATRWFSWEQVNFNAAVHHALRDLLPVLSAHEHKLETLRAQLAEAEARRAELAQYTAELMAQLTQIHAELRTELRTEIDSQRRASETQRSQVDGRFAELLNELRERDARLREEQRVCFKQLALETSEAAALEDRARRKTETLVEELKRRVERLEKKGED